MENEREAVTHHGRTITYRHEDRGGNGAPILCVHGSGGSHAVWKSQFRLADNRPVVAIDLSSHGDSDDVDADPGFGALSAYAGDVIAVAEETGARTLVGNSLGGAILLHIALRRDFEPDALVLAGTGAKLAVLEDLRVWLRDDFERAIEFLHEPGHLFYDPDERLVAFSRNAMLECGQEVTRRDFETCHGFDVRDDVGDITVPCLAIVGEHDQLTPPRYHEYLVENVPDAELSVVDDAAHLAMLERPEAFNRALSGYL